MVKNISAGQINVAILSYTQNSVLSKERPELSSLYLFFLISLYLDLWICMYTEGYQTGHPFFYFFQALELLW